MTHYVFTKEGKIKLPCEAEYRKADGEVAILAYTHGIMGDGVPYYAYVAVRPSKYREFYAKSAARQPLVIGDYGTVMAGGFEATPPPEVVQRMRDLGFTDDFEKKLSQDAQKQLKAFMERQEVERIHGIVDMLRSRTSS